MIKLNCWIENDSNMFRIYDNQNAKSKKRSETNKKCTINMLLCQFVVGVNQNSKWPSNRWCAGAECQLVRWISCELEVAIYLNSMPFSPFQAKVPTFMSVHFRVKRRYRADCSEFSDFSSVCVGENYAKYQTVPLKIHRHTERGHTNLKFLLIDFKLIIIIIMKWIDIRINRWWLLYAYSVKYLLFVECLVHLQFLILLYICFSISLHFILFDSIGLRHGSN